MADIITVALNFVKALLNALKEGKAANIIGIINDFWGKAGEIGKGEEAE